MGKKIVIFNGSPHNNGNTAALCKVFAEGAKSAGNTVTRFDLGEMKIHGCLGCMKGGKDKNSPCAQKDDMEKIYPAYQEADMIVLASPMYYWNVSSYLKAVIDRLFAVAELDSNYQNPKKDCVLLMSAGDDTPDNWRPILNYYYAFVDNLGWKDCGKVLAGGNMNEGDIAGKPVLEEARKLGASIA